MPPPPRAHNTAAGSHQARQVRLARARHSLDNTGISIDSSELPSELIADYSIDEVVRLRNVAEVGRREAGNDRFVDEDDDEDDADVDPEEDAELGKEESFFFYVCPYARHVSALDTHGIKACRGS